MPKSGAVAEAHNTMHFGDMKSKKTLRGGALVLTVASFIMPLAACSGSSGQRAVATPPTLTTKKGQEPSDPWGIVVPTDDDMTEDAKKLRDLDMSLFVGSPDILNTYYSFDDPTRYYTDWPTKGLAANSDAIYDQAVASYKECIDYLEKLDTSNLSESENRLREDMLFDFQNKMEVYKHHQFIPALNPSSGQQISYPLLMSLIQFKSKSDVDRYLKILEDFYEYFDNAMTIEETRSSMGAGWSDETLDLIIKDCKKMIEDKDVHFMRTTFESRVGALKLSSTESKSFIRKNSELLEEKYFPTYEMLIERLTALKGSSKGNKTMISAPGGKDYYEALFRTKSGTSMTPEEGIKFLQKSIDEIYDTYYPTWKQKGTLFRFGGLSFDEARDWCERFTKEHYPAIGSNTVAVYEVPKEFAESMPPAMYYVSPIDNYTKHQVWVNTGLFEDSRYDMFTIVSHEMYPGHLYQHQYQAETLGNKYQAFAASLPYAEGWAQYSEWRMIQYAPFEQELAQSAWMADLFYSALVSARLSMGVEYEGWDYDRCLTYIKKYGQDDKVMDEYWTRITGSQGYALEYAFGYLFTSEIINTAIEKLDGKVSPEDVITAYLDLGCAPFDALSRDMESYVKEMS